MFQKVPSHSGFNETVDGESSSAYGSKNIRTIRLGRENSLGPFFVIIFLIMIIVFTGNGKGKTTASLGQMMRVLGRGKRALMIQFIKGPWKSGEDELGEKLQIPKDKFQIRKMGKGFVGILGDQLPREEHEKAAKEALECFKKELDSGNWDLIVLDEVNVAVSLKLLEEERVLEAISKVPDDKFVILTGRGAPDKFIEAAHLVTEMREIKHPFNEGKMAKAAMEF